MAYVVECLNPFSPFKEVSRHEVLEVISIRNWLKKTKPGFVEFPRPTICILNGEALLRKDWDYEMKGEDLVAFVSQPGSFVPPQVWYALAAIIIGVGVSLLMPKPKLYQNEGDTVYTIRGQQNKVRLGEAVEVPYGKCRLWPSYAALPYNRFENNDQYQFILLCLGQGEYDVHSIQIEDTEITNFQDVSYAVYGPNVPVSLFDDHVSTSVEVSDVELLGTNEEGYEQWIGPFTVNESGTEIYRIEVDFMMPMGLNEVTDKGKTRSGSISVVGQYRQINDAGEPLGGGWISFINRIWTLSTATAQRFTLGANVAPGRYEVQISRTSAKNKANSSAQMLLWSSLRGFHQSVMMYGEKTMLALKVKATNNLNDQSAFRINVWATRKLPIWDASMGWSAPTATRSIVWALCDIVRASYGGLLDDSYLPLTELQEQDAIYTAQGRFLDFVFDTKATIWEALRVVARIGRAVPMIEGSQIKLVKDTLRTLPEAIFNQNNIVKDSFSWNVTLPKDGDYDGVLVRYTDPNDFLPREITCLIGDDGEAITSPRSGHPQDDTGDNLEELELLGCSNRNWAYREGLYYRRSVRARRQSVRWSTGLEGFLPRFGAMVGISHDVPRWGKGGHVLAVAENQRTLELSEEVAFEEAEIHYIAIKTKDGGNTGPLVCVAGEDLFHVDLLEDLPEDVLISENTEPPVFLFGTSTLGDATSWTKNVIVSRLSPDAEGKVTIEGIIYDESVFDYDNLTAPEIPTVISPGTPPPAVPTLTCSSVSVFWSVGSNTKATATWAPAAGAQLYELEKSVDAGVTWSTLGIVETTSLEFPCNEGGMQLRIRPIGVGYGDWCISTWSMEESEDPWRPRSGPGTYIDLLVRLGLLTMPTGLLNFSTADSSYTLSGWKEFVPSVPPRAFLTATPSGDWTRFYSDGTSIHFSEYQGDMTVVAATGLTALTGVSYFIKASWGGSGGRESYGTAAGLNPRVAGQLVPAYTSNHSGAYSTQRDDSWSSTDYYTGFNGVWYNSRMYQGAYGLTLKDEDSEQAAILRSSGLAWSAWSTTSPVVSSSARGANQYSGNATIGKYKGEFTGATPNWTYKLTMAVKDRVIGASSWETVLPIELSLVADGDGGITVEETYLYPENGHEKKIVSQTWSYSP